MIGGDARKPLTAAQRNVLARMAAEIDYALERVEGPDGAVWWQLRRLRTIPVRTSTALALLSAGYVVKAGSKPRREVYEITPAGRSALSPPSSEESSR